MGVRPSSPALAAAFRLAATLPSRVIERREVAQPKPKQMRKEIRKEARTRREVVRRLLEQGLSQRAIARELGVSRTSVCNHIESLRREGAAR